MLLSKHCEHVQFCSHDVPEEKIRSRCEKSLKRISPLVRIAGVTRIIDNSGSELSLICEVEGQSVRSCDTTSCAKQLF